MLLKSLLTISLLFPLVTSQVSGPEPLPAVQIWEAALSGKRLRKPRRARPKGDAVALAPGTGLGSASGTCVIIEPSFACKCISKVVDNLYADPL